MELVGTSGSAPKVACRSEFELHVTAWNGSEEVALTHDQLGQLKENFMIARPSRVHGTPGWRLDDGVAKAARALVAAR